MTCQIEGKWLVSPFVFLFLVIVTGFSSTVYAEPPSAQRQNELINLVKHDCGSCHGMTLKGGLGPALTTDALKDKPHALLYNTIMLGRDNTAMPPWLGILTEEEITWLVLTLRDGKIAEHENSTIE